MNYPLISEYIEAIKSAEDNFEELSYLRPVLGDDGLPVMTSGNFAVVFKMKDEQSGKLYAVKCFTKEQERRSESYKLIAEELEFVESDYLVPIKFYEDELFVDTNVSEDDEFSVLLMEWVEGKTLDIYLRENLDDKYALEMLAYRFSNLAQWLISKPFAHGDLKPDNILVRQDGTLVLVDYDGMYVPAMNGQKARELGSPDYRHPQRTEDDFDEHIDDFPLVSILLSLKGISNNPSLIEEYSAADRLLFSEKDYFEIGNSAVMKELLLLNDKDITTIIGLFLSVLSSVRLSNLSIQPFFSCTLFSEADSAISHTKYTQELVSIVTQQDLEGAWIDEYGVTYSEDGKKLLKGAPISKYKIRDNTEVICDNAFNEALNNKYIFDEDNHEYEYIGERLEEIIIPHSVKHIGKKAFYGCKMLVDIFLPNAIEEIGAFAFRYTNFGVIPCRNLNLKRIHGPIDDFDDIICSPFFHYEDGILYNKEKNIIFSSDICYGLGESSDDGIDHTYELQEKPKWSKSEFKCERSTQDIFGYELDVSDYYEVIDLNIPDSIIEIGDYAFCGSEGIRSIRLPKSIETIGEGAFAISSLEELYISNPNLIININMFGNARPKLFVPKGFVNKFILMLESKDDDYVKVFGWEGGIYELDGKATNDDSNKDNDDFEDALFNFFNHQ